METLETQGLGRRFGRRWALRDIELHVEEGETVAIWGRSGAGKTTLLHLLATLIRPSEGEAKIDGHDLRRQPGRVRSVVGAAFRPPALDPDLTALELLELRAAMHSVSHANRTSRIVKMLHLVGLESHHESRIDTLTPSQSARLEVAATLLPSPRVLLLDEPFLEQDEEMTSRIWESLLDLRSRERTTLLLATTNADVAERCGRIAVLNEGRLLAFDTPDRIRGAAGKDRVTVEPIDDRLTTRRLQERMGVVVSEEANGFRIEIERGDALATEMVGQFGDQIRAVYVKRPDLAAGLQRVVDSSAADPMAVRGGAKPEDEHSWMS